MWRKILRTNIRSIDELISFLELDPKKRASIDISPTYPINIPRRLAQKIKKNCVDDPLFKQFVPTKDELIKIPYFGIDPLMEDCFQKTKNLLQKYHGRSLILTAATCAMNCRFCFRRHTLQTKTGTFEEELKWLKNNSSCTEVILSGGDPLILSNSALKDLLEELNGIKHLKRIRFHSRFLIGIPERIDSGLIRLLKKSEKQIWFVLHVNHAQELDEDVFHSVKVIQKLGIPVLSQTVLLHGVNDSVEALKDLFTILINNGIQPYYLHQLDRVLGVHHFEVSESEGKALIEKLKAELPGYAIPRYVREQPHASSKSPL